jgi:hypothetical protein
MTGWESNGRREGDKDMKGIKETKKELSCPSP